MVSDRARQFLPFDALKGFKEAIKERQKIKVEKIELSEEMPRRFFHRQSGMRKLCNRQHFCLAAEFLQS